VVDADCTTSACDARSSSCVASHCLDHRRDGDETDVDCGGSCSPCALYAACAHDGDCAPGTVCNAVLSTCVTPRCYDGVRDGNESDVDCGGTCAPCPLGGACAVDQDCASQACDAGSHACVADQCNDHRQDGLESDVDCGRTCTLCALGQKCGLGWDCASNTCAGTCHLPWCADGVKDQTETDVDCGGGLCPPCATGLGCRVDSDCQSSACDALSLTCITDHCIDHRFDGDETDTDCGGPTCSARCGSRQLCQLTSDCAAGLTCTMTTPHFCQ
jgi:hypothetical protein